MRKTAIKLGISLVTMPVSLFLIGLTKIDYFFILFMVAVLLSILYWIDLGSEIRNTENKSSTVRIFGILMGVPQALFGLICAFVGLVIIIWVLYNIFIERQSQFTGGFLSFGIGPALVLFGSRWLVSAFRKNSDESNGL